MPENEQGQNVEETTGTNTVNTGSPSEEATTNPTQEQLDEQAAPVETAPEGESA